MQPETCTDAKKRLLLERLESQKNALKKVRKNLECTGDFRDKYFYLELDLEKRIRETKKQLENLNNAV